jgi:hypothetical protein
MEKIAQKDKSRSARSRRSNRELVGLDATEGAEIHEKSHENPFGRQITHLRRIKIILKSNSSVEENQMCLQGKELIYTESNSFANERTD